MSLCVNIQKKLGSFTLQMAFETDQGALALLGASGCGKSVTLKCIAGILRPDEGKIILNNKTLFDSAAGINLPPQKRHVGYLFQQYALFPNMSVEQNIAAGVRKEAAGSRRDIVREKIRMMQLTGLEKRRPHQLSGGQQQRVALARILVNEPDLLLLDEPFTALDSHLKWQLELEVSALLRDFGRTTIIVTHDRDEAYRLCDSIAVLSSGQLDALGEKWDIFKSPQTYAACQLTGCKNLSPIKREGGALIADHWALPLDINGPLPEDAAFVGIRAHHLQPCADLCGENAFEYEITDLYESPFSYILMVRSKKAPGARSLRWELGKEDYATIRDLPPYVRLPQEKLMLLRKSK